MNADDRKQASGPAPYSRRRARSPSSPPSASRAGLRRSAPPGARSTPASPRSSRPWTKRVACRAPCDPGPTCNERARVKMRQPRPHATRRVWLAVSL
eukprot:4276961-Prymnesium_polylepis.1